MRLLKKHTLIPADATPEQVKEALAQSSFRAIKRTLAILTGDPEKLLKKGRNIRDIMEFPLDDVIAIYNVVALTINYNLGQALAVIKQFIQFLPKLVKIRTINDTVGIFAEAEETDEDVEAESL